MTKNRALFLDRDGVINEDIGYVGSIERFSFLPGLFPFLRAVRDFGYRFAVLTNQSGVARGYYSIDDYHSLTNYMVTELRRENIEIESVLACFEHDKGVVPEFTRQSFWRKPLPGMVLEAIRRLNVDPSRSAFLGNELTDMQAAINGGIRRRLLLTQDYDAVPPGVDIVKNLDEALALLKAPFV